MARPENYQELRRAADENTQEPPSQRGGPTSILAAAAAAAAVGGQGALDISSALNTASLISLTDGSLGGLGGLGGATGLFQTPTARGITETRSTDMTQNSLEHVRQDILTMHTLLSTMSIANDGNANGECTRVPNDDGDLEEKHQEKESITR